MSYEDSSVAAGGERRPRRLTEKAQQIYIEKTEKFTTKLIKYRKSVEETIMRYQISEKIKAEVRLLKTQLDKQFEEYEIEMQKFEQFLANTNTAESFQEMDSQNTIHMTVSENVVQTLHEMEMVLKKISNPTSLKSVKSSRCSSRSSEGSVRSSVIAQQKAKAEAAKARLEFEMKEAELLKEKARLNEEQMKVEALTMRKKSELDADLKVLDKQRDVVMAEVELKAYEEENDVESVHKSLLSNKKTTNIEHYDIVPKPFDFIQTPLPKIVEHVKAPSVLRESGLNPGVESFVPSKDYTDLSKYLLKKDLLMDRFYKFDDSPKTFNIWKSSFRSILQDLDTSPAEEFDLLLKYLGPESRKYAISIRAANANNLVHGLKCLWDRLHQRYGSAEMIEATLKKKLEKFPKLGTKDNKKLFDLSDILSEISSAKEDPKYQTLLSYFDSSTGVLPIVHKLPNHVQSKWMSRAMTYKKTHDVHFPPFSEFCSFISDMSSMLNDPGLAFATSDKQGTDKQYTKFNRSNHVAVHKTNVMQFDTCPIHGVKHSLNQCRTFKQKTVSDRKRYLRDHNICYKCCNSDTHTYKTCTFSVKCEECGSDRHPSALHFFQRASSVPPVEQYGRERPPVEQYGRERPPSKVIPENTALKEGLDHQVSTNCTSICGKGFTGKSCSKTVLVKVYPEGESHKAKTMYCIIDDQSNRTLCKPELFDLLGVDSVSDEQYTLVSCAGSYPTQESQPWIIALV